MLLGIKYIIFFLGYIGKEKGYKNKEEAAKALAKHFDVILMYCFEKKGVLMSETDDESVIPEIKPDLFQKYVKNGIISGGMIPKLENAFDAINAGVKEVVITRADLIHTNGGTKILGNS